MGRVRGPKSIVGLTAVLAVSGIALLFLAVRALDLADQWASVGSFAIGAAGLVVGVLALRQDRRTTLAERLDRLAEVVDAQWRDEAEIRGLGRPLLAVRLTGAGGGESTVGRLLRGLPAQRLVIVGAPGSGKTVLAIRLVRELLQHREPGDPVPVLFSVGAWHPEVHRHPHEWMAAQLGETYPAFRQVALELLRGRHVLPVLDGLDEVPDHLRTAVLQALNRIVDVVDRPDPLVLTCRAEEYRELVGLAEASVVELRPVRVEDVERYLTGDGWAPVFDHVRAEPDGPLARALSTPLMVSLARTADDPGALLALRTQEEVERHLLSRFVPALYPDLPRPDGRRDRWRVGRATDWLRFLASRPTPDIAWWQLVDVVPRAVIALASGGAGLAAVLLGFWVMGVPGNIALLVAFVIGATCLFVGWMNPRPKATTIRFGSGFRSDGDPRVLLAAVLGGLAVGFLLGWVVSPTAAVVGALTSGVAWGLVATSGAADTARAASPRSLLGADRVVALVSGLPLALLLAVLITFATTPLNLPRAFVVFWLWWGLIPTINSAWAKLAVARCWLALRGQVPLRTMAFLDDAHRRGVLRRIGPTYQFRHERLREHLAGGACCLE